MVQSFENVTEGQEEEKGDEVDPAVVEAVGMWAGSAASAVHMSTAIQVGVW
jgi:hypothetical protein